MPAATSTVIPKFRQRLQIIYALAGITLDSEFATRLDVAKSTMAGYAQGNPTKGTVAGQLPAKAIAALSAEISKLTKGRISSERAKYLLFADLNIFTRELFALPAADFGWIGADPGRSLTVKGQAKPRNGLSLIDLPYNLPDGAILVQKSEGVSFEVDLNANTQLLVLSEFQGSWQLAVPGGLHSGAPGSDEVTVVPENPDHLIKFLTRGFYRFLFFELDAESAKSIALRPGPDGFVDRLLVDQLALTLRDLDAVRASEVFIAFDMPDAKA